MSYYLDAGDRARLGIEEPDEACEACEACHSAAPPVRTESADWADWWCADCGALLGSWSREPEPPNELPF